jgi:hypothetical protein
MKRREFLASSLAVGAAAAWAPASAMAAPILGTDATAAQQSGAAPAVAAGAATAAGLRVPSFSQEWFARLLNTSFRIHTPNGVSTDAELIAVENRDCCPKLHQYTVTFRLSEQIETGGLCIVEHAHEGRFHLFLDPALCVGATTECRAQFTQVA